MGKIKIAINTGRHYYLENTALALFVRELREAGCDVSFVSRSEELSMDTDILLSVGGDGTFLYAASLAAEKGIPILGVNFGRLGFLSEARPEGIAQLLARGEYIVEERILLRAEVSGGAGFNASIDGAARAVGSAPAGEGAADGKGSANAGESAADGNGSANAGEGAAWPYALNEITVHRAGAAMLGVDVAIDGVQLPTYWADGLLVATPSGSTAYSLSVGGPIVMPEAEVLVVAPISPHNLNVRPLVVPKTSKIEIGLLSREKTVVFTRDNRTEVIDESSKISVSMAQFSLKRIRLNASNFINALTSKLFWGGDIRNSTE